MMGAIIFWFVVGLLVGWNLLPQPVWVKTAWDKVLTKAKSLFNKEDKTEE